MRSLSYPIYTGLLLLFLGGCALSPHYQRPEMPVAGTLESDSIYQPIPSAGDIQTENVSDIGWGEFFADTQLQNIIKTTLENNRNLKQTALNVQIYQTQYRIQRSPLYPAISADGYGLKQHSLSSGQYATSEIYSLEAATTSWELDFFGRISSLKDQALEQFLAMEETHKSAKISLVAKVVKAYLSLLADRELLHISEDTKKVEEESYYLIEQRVNGGIADQMDLAQARTSLETVKVNLALYKRKVALDTHYLTLLTGAPLPDSLTREQRVLTDVKPIAVLPSSLSSSILLQRPDIIAAEHELKGANASIGAARAAFFPKISLTAGAGFISSDLSDLFSNGSGSWRFSPSISIPIFNAGQLQAQLDVAEIQKDLSIAKYEYAIQTAFREVSDALVTLETYDEQLEAQRANLDANQEYYSHAKSRYEEGIDSFLTLLIAQRSLYAARQDYLTMQLNNMENRVNLYKVLGGGWKETTTH